MKQIYSCIYIYYRNRIEFFSFIILKMIYDTNEVDNVRICKNCEANIEIPKSLPYGEAICFY